ncbi:MAG: FAD-binding protein [Deltaproteobacteria bacterium]|nr:FAD-binding protein [Deltaproteobacteria bacterium]
MSADTATTNWDQTVDLLIVGSGAGAMTAALTAYDRGAAPLLIEKSDRYGGNSAMSGGGLWVPCNPLMDSVGIKDSSADAWAYLKATVGEAVAEDRLRAYLEQAPQLVKYLTEHSRVKFVALPEYADYYPHAPGWRPGGRCIEPTNFDARLLGDEFLNLREQNPQMLIMNRIFMTVLEARTLLTRAAGWIALTMKLMGGYWLDLPWRFKSKRDRNLAMGNALVGMLRRSLMDRGIPLWLQTAARELVVENGRVVGVVADKNGRRIRIRADKGVVLAAGGFEHHQAMREKYLPNPTRTEWSCGNHANTGDAINLGLAVGAALDLMDDAWWGPVTLVPGESHARILVIEKSLPGSIMVNKRGERFVNEAAPYIDVVNAMYKSNTPDTPCVPAYVVFDATFRKKYPYGPILQASQQPDWALPKPLKGYLKKADTLEGLAAQLDLDPAGLRATITKFNQYARSGTDLDFHRGETVFDRYYGDEKVKPNACLAAIATPPFYGIAAYPGELGTKGGLKADARARVLTEAGQPIPGLYAVGNCSAATMGHSYPGAGATIGPAMTFGYIAARDAVGAA